MLAEVDVRTSAAEGVTVDRAVTNAVWRASIKRATSVLQPRLFQTQLQKYSAPLLLLCVSECVSSLLLHTLGSVRK